MFNSGQSGIRGRRFVKLKVIQMALKLVKDKEVEFLRGRISDCFDTLDLFYNGLNRLSTKGITAFNITIVLPETNNANCELSGSNSEKDKEEGEGEEGRFE